jgi:hypothetical protein
MLKTVCDVPFCGFISVLNFFFWAGLLGGVFVKLSVVVGYVI